MSELSNSDHHHQQQQQQRQRTLSLSISSSTSSLSPSIKAIDHSLNSIQLQHKLPTPISPTTTTHNFGSLVSQFSVKPSNPSTEDTSKLYTCIECGQNFNRAHNLKSHRATHSASKPYQCPECEKQFLRLHDLKRHQKLHTGERPYQCPVCQRSFSRLDALNRHRKTEGGSACLKITNNNNNNNSSSSRSSSSNSSNKNIAYSPNKRTTISPCLLPTLPSSSTISQWQLNSTNSNKTLPSPFLPKPNLTTATVASNPTLTNTTNNNTNTTISINTATAATAATTTTTTTNNNIGMTSPTTPLPFILPFNNTPSNSLIEDNHDEIDKLRQRIHDLEIENRVLRSLLCKQDDTLDSSLVVKRRRST